VVAQICTFYIIFWGIWLIASVMRYKMIRPDVTSILFVVLAPYPLLDSIILVGGTVSPVSSCVAADFADRPFLWFFSGEIVYSLL